MAFTHGPYTFDAIADGDAAAFDWTDQTGTTTALQTANTAGRWCFDTDGGNSTGVGPDYGQGGDPDGYAYTEMTSQTSGDIWYMEFNTNLDASANNIEFDYYWCMRGSSVRTVIQLQSNENGAGWVDRGSATGYGDETIPATSGATTWFNKTVDLTGLISHASTRLRLKITTTSDPTTDMWNCDTGIDTVTITGTTSTTYKIEGVTKDSSGTALGSCDVYLFLNNVAEDDPEFLEHATSNSSTGAYSFTGLTNSASRYFVIAKKDGTDNVFDTTDHVLVPVEE